MRLRSWLPIVALLLMGGARPAAHGTLRGLPLPIVELCPRDGLPDDLMPLNLAVDVIVWIALAQLAKAVIERRVPLLFIDALVWLAAFRAAAQSGSSYLRDWRAAKKQLCARD
jgi:hypothetical protein